MTYHIHQEEYKCKKCSVVYIPFNKYIVCPNCGNPSDTDKYLGFIDELISSMRVHKLRYGRFMPPAWYEGSFVENMQSNCFNTFDRLGATKPKDERAWLSEVVAKNNEFPKEYMYLVKHITDIIITVYPRYISENKFKPNIFRKWLVRLLSGKLLS